MNSSNVNLPDGSEQCILLETDINTCHHVAQSRLTFSAVGYDERRRRRLPNTTILIVFRGGYRQRRVVSSRPRQGIISLWWCM